MEISGGAYDTVRDNLIIHNGAWGVVTHDFPDTERRRRGRTARAASRCPRNLCDFPAHGNKVDANFFSDDGFFGNATNSDMATVGLLPTSATPRNCFYGNRDAAGRVTSEPKDIQTAAVDGKPCGQPGTSIDGALVGQLTCAAEFGQPVPAGGALPEADQDRHPGAAGAADDARPVRGRPGQPLLLGRGPHLAHFRFITSAAPQPQVAGRACVSAASGGGVRRLAGTHRAAGATPAARYPPTRRRHVRLAPSDLLAREGPASPVSSDTWCLRVMFRGFRRTDIRRRNPMRAGRNGRGVARGVAGLAAVLLCGSPAVAGAQASAGSVTTVAGGVGGPAKATTVSIDACGVSFAGGHVYVPSNEAVREVDPATDRLTTPAGSGVSGPFVEAGPAADAAMASCGAAVDPQGNLLIADVLSQRIRVVPASTGEFYGQAMQARHIYTVAGNGIQGFSGDGGPATSAELEDPDGGGGGRRREPGDRRHRQRPDPGGRGEHRHASTARR